MALEVSEQPLVASNVDLTEARAGGLGSDLAARFLDAFAEAAGLTLHVRLIDGEDSRHVLEAIFKALRRRSGGSVQPSLNREGEPVAEKEIVRTERAPAPFEGAPYNPGRQGRRPRLRRPASSALAPGQGRDGGWWRRRAD